MHAKATWIPTEKIIKNSNIYKMMREHHFSSYIDFWRWSVEEKAQFWSETVQNLKIKFSEKPIEIVNTSQGVEGAKWLYGSKLNIVDSCFQNADAAVVIKYQDTNKLRVEVTQYQLELLVNRIANGFTVNSVYSGDTIAIDMPMNIESTAIYLAAIKAGVKVATIADSFSANQIAVRLQLTKPKLVFTQDVLLRNGKELPLYKRVIEANASKIVVVCNGLKSVYSIREIDILYEDFLSDNDKFESVKQSPEETITILFSSGTTGEPKAIPWNHSTPIKGASDGYYHHDIHENDVVCWPTNLGWMMGPWLVFSTLINRATIALYGDVATKQEFGLFVEEANVTMLGVVPSIVKHWKNSQAMEQYDWSSIKCFSSTGEVSNPEEMKYLMNLAGNKPIIEYCGGTEIGGGYVTSTLVQPNIPSTFSTQALGGEFVLLGEDNKEYNKGELFLIPPIMGLSTTLLNRDHHKVYYQDTPEYISKLRRHGDELLQLENGYYQALGRVDDAMNLGGIKISATQIELIIDTLSFVAESAAVAITPENGGPSELVVFYVEALNDLDQNSRFEKAQMIVRKELNPLFKVMDLVKINTLPRTASNKVLRRNLRDKYKRKG